MSDRPTPEMDAENETQDRSARHWVKLLIRRCRNACRTNEPQSTTAIMLSLMMVAAAGRAGAEWWQCAIAGAFWPTIAFLSNLNDPISVAVYRAADSDEVAK